jgi:NADPH-dependent glutamate synthase beta subunit-like oxidoreductase
MQDPYGFLRHPRQEAGKQTVRQRVRHGREYVSTMPESRAARQAQRCMDCGTPCCHPVTIKGIERAIADRAGEQDWVRPQPGRETRRQWVAVVGSGSAGLACAEQLVVWAIREGRQCARAVDMWLSGDSSLPRV